MKLVYYVYLLLRVLMSRTHLQKGYVKLTRNARRYAVVSSLQIQVSVQEINL